jgi:hypothetical protein
VSKLQDDTYISTVIYSCLLRWISVVHVPSLDNKSNSFTQCSGYKAHERHKLSSFKQIIIFERSRGLKNGIPKHKLFLRLNHKFTATPAVLQLVGVMLATLLFSLATKYFWNLCPPSHVWQLHGRRWRVFSMVGQPKVRNMCVHKENYVFLIMYQYSILLIE